MVGTSAPPVTASPSPAFGSSPTPVASTAATSSVTCGTAAIEPAVAFPNTPDADPFYAQPNQFPSVARGTILASRQVSYEVDGTSMPNQSWQLKFASCDAYQHPIAAVATIVKPTAAMPGTEPMLVEAFAEDALAARCAPSHALTGDTEDSNEDLESAIPTEFLAVGWTVLFPDYEGPQSEFSVGRLEGQTTLDSIRAAEQFAPAGLDSKTPVGLNGYSGGAIAMGWTASLQKTYAPELNLVGFTLGGTPADLIGIMKNIDATSSTAAIDFFNVVFMLTVGANRANPTFLTPIFNATGVGTATSIENGCVGKTSDGGSGPTGPFSQYLTTNDYASSPGVVAEANVFDLAQPGLSPIAEMFVYQSQMDEVIPIAGVDKMVSQWCSSGSEVSYDRIPAGDHIATEVDTEPVVFAYLTARYQGVTPTLPAVTTTCN